MVLWIGFLVLIFIFLALDLGVFHKDSKRISTREALTWTIVWVSVSLIFSGVIYWIYQEGLAPNPNGLSGKNAVLKYLTGYIIELSLSMDNVFVIAIIFAYFKVPSAYQHRVLFWGILGAIFFRAVMILVGVVLIKKFAWMTFAFGALLLYSAFKMLISKGTDSDPEHNRVVRLIKKVFPVTRQFEGEQFFVRKKHILAATPLFVALIVVETTDILFAIDSIPAILAITTDPFLVFSSNIFAILGLRSLYFVLSSMLDKFQLLKYSLVIILAFVGVKMILIHYNIQFPEWLSLSVIVFSLLAGVILSLVQSSKNAAEQAQH